MTYGYFKDLNRKRIADQVLRDKAFDTISLSRHEQVYLIRLRFERYFSHHRET